jgi:hypothetical protein
MSAKGVDFLEKWIQRNVLPNAGDRTQARKLAQKLVVDAMTARLKVWELELGDSDVEKYILDAMMQLDTPGTPGD